MHTITFTSTTLPFEHIGQTLQSILNFTLHDDQEIEKAEHEKVQSEEDEGLAEKQGEERETERERLSEEEETARTEREEAEATAKEKADKEAAARGEKESI